MGVREILEKESLERADLITLLNAEDEEKKLLFEKGTAVKLAETAIM